MKERDPLKFWGNFLGRLLLIALGLLLPLLMLEIGVRWLNLAPPPQPNPAIWEPHPLLGWWHIPYSGGLFHSNFNEFEAEVRINARGLRDREIGYDNPKGALRILSLADSFGEALQVNLEQTYHKQLEGLLADSLDQPVEVLNAGVGGWGTDQEAIFYVAEGFRYEPKVVLLAFFVRNDMVNNYGPLERASIAGSQQKEFFSLSPSGELILPPLRSEAALKETSAGPSGPTQPKAPYGQANPHPGAGAGSMLFSIEPQLDNSPLLLPLADGLWQVSALYRLVVPYVRDIPPAVQKLGPSGILGGEGVVRAEHPTTPVHFFVYQSPPDKQFEAAWILTEAIIKRLRDEVESRGAKLAVVIIGAPEQVYPAEGERMLAANSALQDLSLDLELPNRRLNNFLASENIPHLDLLPIFRRATTQPNAPPLHFRHDGHWTVAGHQLAAEAIYDFLRNELGGALN